MSSVICKVIYMISSLLITLFTALILLCKISLLVFKNGILKFMTSIIDLSISSFYHLVSLPILSLYYGHITIIMSQSIVSLVVCNQVFIHFFYFKIFFSDVMFAGVAFVSMYRYHITFSILLFSILCIILSIPCRKYITEFFSGRSCWSAHISLLVSEFSPFKMTRIFVS